jgi:hypothetical protein
MMLASVAKFCDESYVCEKWESGDESENAEHMRTLVGFTTTFGKSR